MCKLSFIQLLTCPPACRPTGPAPPPSCHPLRTEPTLSGITPTSLPHPVPPPSLSPPTQPATLNSGSWTVKYPTSFVLSQDAYERERQETAIHSLELKYGSTAVCHIPCHRFEWRKYPSGVVTEEWLPFYIFKKGLTVAEIWTEWTVGLEGCFSVRDLNDGWEARWRRNNAGQKTENARRRKVVALIEALGNQPNWDTSLALRFLNDKYKIPTPSVPHLRSTRAFIDYLQDKRSDTQSSILAGATSYPYADHA